MFKASRSLSYVLLGFVSLSLFACRVTKSRAKSVTPSLVPAVPQLQLMIAEVEQTSANVKHILLRSPDSVAGLSASFSAEAQTSQAQIVGLMPANEEFPTVNAIVLSDGRTINCESSSRKPALLKILQTSADKFDCGGTEIRVRLKSESASADRYAKHLLDRGLLNGASFVLNAVDNNEQLIEVTLQGTTAHLARNSSTGNSLQRANFSTDEIKNFLLFEKPLTLPCPDTQCAQSGSVMTLLKRNNGDLVLIKGQGPSTSQQNDMPAPAYRRAGSEGLRVSSYNVENFWDDVADNSKPYDDFSPTLSDWYSGQFAAKKAARIREALLAAGVPDVVGLQEIESANNQSRSLEILKSVLSPLGYNYYALGQQATDNPTAVTTAFISKYPILENVRLDFLFESDQLKPEERDDFVNASRDPQRISVGLPEGVSLTLFNSHWKSKRDKSPIGDDMRRSIGKLMREHLEALVQLQGQPVPAIIMGDFNADYRETAVQEGLQLAASLSAARTDKNSLFNLWQTRDAQHQGDYPHDTELTAIDNMVVSQPVLSAHTFVLNQPLRVVGEFGFASRLLRNGDLQPLRSQRHQIKDADGQLKTFHKDLGYSDHLPLVAEFSRSLSRTRLVSSPLTKTTIEQQVIAQLPRIAVPSAECAESETQRIHAEQLTQALLNAQRGDCLEINTRITLRKTGLFNMAFDLPEAGQLSGSQRIVIISADRAFGANRSWLRSTLQQSEGKTVSRVRGRLGLIDGVKALFVSTPSADIVFE